ncbi:MAG: phosphoribosylformylglycinamidine synthase subunit PurQ, partial [Actinobacteria bacterium]|nr:phosphoribosylformylglycinamidine synthase subunit PurQ [Actinomycetota bacterium]
MARRVAVVVFPGTNCELDVARAISSLGAHTESVFHLEDSLGSAEAVIIPGGFAHGDYLRTGALAQFSPIMESVSAFAAAGGPVLGICNGFQILTETGLLPGALQKNAGLKFLCASVGLSVASNRSVLTRTTTVGDQLQIPINHFEGNYICDRKTLAQMKANDQIVL